MNILQCSTKAALSAGLMVEEKMPKTGVGPDAVLVFLPVATVLGTK